MAARKAARKTGKPTRKTRKSSPRTTRKSGKKSRAASGRSKTGSRSAKKTARPATKQRVSFRLDPEVRPVAYELSLRLDPLRGPEYSGEVRITVELTERRSSVKLHSVDLDAEAYVETATPDASPTPIAAKVVPKPADEAIEITPERRLDPGRVTLVIQFTGRLREDLRGLYQARSGPHTYAFTQLEATDARRFFPCFDEPCFKAPLTLTVVTAAQHQVVANSPATKVKEHGTQRTWHFEPTAALPTYLYALAVGALECSEPTHLGNTAIRVWHVPGKEHLTAFALEAARESLSRLEGYFDIPYPYPKLDLVAAPDFEIGAMENAGAVFFRETLLLLDPERAARHDQIRAAEVIAHELAHMWYGDLVTPYWWDDLWLKEAFATWMSFAVVDDWRPEWNVWLEFQNRRASAMDLDALKNTHPIYARIESPEEATENFDTITYKKGASVVRMIEQYLTPLVFRDGVRQYMRTHADGNASGTDLWRALSEVSGQDVTRVVRGWIEQEGFPVLLLSRGKGDKVRVRQERFVETPGSGVDDSRWPVPFVGRRVGHDGEDASHRQLLTRRNETLDVAALADSGEVLAHDGPLYGNAGENGFYRVLHDAAWLEQLTASFAKLADVERMGLLGHQWACVRAGRAPVDSYLGLVSACVGDPSAVVLESLLDPCTHLVRDVARHAGDDTVAAMQRWLIDRFAGDLVALGWEGPDDEPERRLRRAAVYALLGSAGRWAPVREHARVTLPRFLEDPTSLEPDLADAVVFLAAAQADDALHSRLVSEVEGATDPLARRRFLLSLACMSDPKLVDRSIALSLTDIVPTQDVVVFLVTALKNPAATERTWRFVKRRFPALSRRLTPSLVPNLIDALPALQTRDARQDVLAFFRKHPAPTARRALLQMAETFDLQIALRRREASRLKKWLRA